MPVSLSGRAALIVSECQRGMVEPGMGGFEGLIRQVRDRGILPRIAVLAEAFRRAALPVVHLPIIHRADFADVLPNSLSASIARKNRLLVSGGPEADFVAELMPQPQDFIAAADPHTHDVILRDQLHMVARIASAADIMAALGQSALR